jgi:hypothetical protein
MLLADRVLPGPNGLIAAAYASLDPIARAAAAILDNWDRYDGNADDTSRGAVLFEAWWALVTSQTPPPPLPHPPRTRPALERLG